MRGNELGASAEGLIRKSDGAVDITGTIIPAYALNAAIGDIPLVGDILTGGKGQGIIGVTFALGGTIDKPVFQMNPVSAVAPGIFRKFFEYGNTGQGNKSPGPQECRERLGRLHQHVLLLAHRELDHAIGVQHAHGSACSLSSDTA